MPKYLSLQDHMCNWVVAGHGLHQLLAMSCNFSTSEERAKAAKIVSLRLRRN